MKLEDIKKYIALYDIESYIFNIIGPSVKKRGYFTFEEFYKICIWKSPRPKKKYIKNISAIGEVSRKAFSETNERSRISVLLKLEGVGLPTASALLTSVFPEKYAIIDIRCLEIVRERFNDKIGKIISINVWIEYLEEIRKRALEYKITPRELEKALFAIHKEKLDKTFKNLYG